MRQESLYFLVGLSPTQVKPNQQSATQSALCEVTNTMKPLEGSSQTATQVKVLSPVIKRYTPSYAGGLYMFDISGNNNEESPDVNRQSYTNRRFYGSVSESKSHKVGV